MSISFGTLINKLEVQIRGNLSFQGEVKNLLYDSRKLLTPKGTMFFAIKAQRQDGHDFIPELYKSGVRMFVVSQDIDIDSYPEAVFIQSDSSIKVLQRIAAIHRSEFDIPVVSITGSNGKTTIKEWLFQLLHGQYSIAKSPKSYNSQIGVPLSIWGLNKNHSLGIFEAGISKVGEMQNLASVIQPSIGIFTNIGDAHNAGFEDISQKVEEKAKLFSSCTKIIYSSDHELIRDVLERTYPEKELLSWGEEGSFIQFSIKSFAQGNTQLRFVYNDKEYVIPVSYYNDFAIENLMHCICSCLTLNISVNEVISKLELLRMLPMRLEIKRGINQCQLINDSYNLDLSSLNSALEFAIGHKGNNDLSLIVSEMDESHIANGTILKSIATICNRYPIKKLYGIGESLEHLDVHLESEIHFEYFRSTDSLLHSVDAMNFSNETILIKGARKFGLERVFDHLSNRIHNTVLEINLSNLSHNLNQYAAKLDLSTDIMVVVKASAYGSGSTEVGRFLEGRSVDYLAVAYTDEGIDLRKAGIGLPIMVMNPEISSFSKLLSHQLEAEIYSMEQLMELDKLCTKLGKKTNIHIKFDTGMHRLGFEAKDIEGISQILKNQDNIRIKTTMSHLVGSDSEEFDSFSLKQISVFNDLSKKLCESLGYNVKKHILNSSGIIRFPEYQMDMVRLGIGLYGIDTSKDKDLHLQKVHSLKTRISQIRTIEAGESVGYNRNFIADKKMTIATLAIGYADGLIRNNSKTKNISFKLHGQDVALLGTICMDMCMIDISHVQSAKVGDMVEIFGQDASIEKLAQSYETIPYEILSRISERVKRVYYEE